MLSKREEKLIRSLHNKKFRKLEQLFIVEGDKLLEELKNSELELQLLLCSNERLQLYDSAFSTQLREVEEGQMKALSALTTPPGVLAIVKIPSPSFSDQSFILYLDGISDPGNMGTIIRTAEGFGVKQIVLSKNCVDIFSPKVVQSSMGSLFRMSFQYADLEAFYQEKNHAYQFYTADMSGDEIYQTKLKSPAVLILGSESQGVSNTAKELESQVLSIPISDQLESLNVAISNAIILSEFKRRNLI